MTQLIVVASSMNWELVFAWMWTGSVTIGAVAHIHYRRR